MENSNIGLSDYNRNFTELKKLIYSMNLMAAFSKNILDPLTEKVLQQLEKEINFEKLKEIIEYELCVTYGLYLDEFNSEEIASAIMNWWDSR